MTQETAYTSVSTTDDFHSMRFDSIQALRGISAIFIVLEHVRFLNCGAFGVDIFFCISGFMTMHSTQRDASHFLGKRLIRVLPFYYLMTLVTFLALLLIPESFAQTKANPAFLVKSLLFIPFDIGGGTLQPLMRVGWTVNCEIFFYLIFWISMKLNYRYRDFICGCILLLFIGLAQMLPTDFAPLTFYGDPVMADFLLGILCYHIAKGIFKRYTTNKLPGFYSIFCLWLTVVCFIGLIATKHSIDIMGFRRPLLWGIPAAIIVLSAFTAGLSLKMPHSLVQLGDISFSLYLVHYYPVVLLDRIIFDFGSCTPFSILGVVLALIISVILALVGGTLIEKRLTTWLRRILLSS